MDEDNRKEDRITEPAQDMTEEELKQTAGGYYKAWPGEHCPYCGSFLTNPYVYVQHIIRCEKEKRKKSQR